MVVAVVGEKTPADNAEGESGGGRAVVVLICAEVERRGRWSLAGWPAMEEAAPVVAVVAAASGGEMSLLLGGRAASRVDSAVALLEKLLSSLFKSEGGSGLVGDFQG